ncbi:hypothetical protein [Streptomyces sp. SBT349]|nr:hypothetical protein [Streptomyces sp. SBT349]
MSLFFVFVVLVSGALLAVVAPEIRTELRAWALISVCLAAAITDTWGLL